MQQSIVSIRMEENLKQKFDFICNELGLSVSAAVTIFAKQVCREGRIPFEITLGKKYEEKNYMNQCVNYRVVLYTMEDFFERIEKKFENLDDALKYISSECDKLYLEYETRICFAITLLNVDNHSHIISFEESGLCYICDGVRTSVKYDDEIAAEDDMYLTGIVNGYIQSIIRQTTL